MKKKISSILITIISLGLISLVLTIPILNDLTYIGVVKELFPHLSELKQIFNHTSETSITEFVTITLDFILLSVEIVILVLISIRSLFAYAMRNQKIKVFGKTSIVLITSLVLVFFSHFYEILIKVNLPILLNKVVTILTNVKLNIGFYVIIGSHIVIMIIEAIRRYEIRKNPDERKTEVISVDAFLRYENKEYDKLDLETYIDCNGFMLGLLKLSLTLLTIVTLTFGLSYSLVTYRKYVLSHTVFESKKYYFDCTSMKMFKELCKLGLLSFITLGIYLLKVGYDYKKFVLENTHRKG